MRDLRIETANGTVFAKAAGDADSSLVLGIHGWSQRNGWHTWEPLMQPLANAGFFVVSLDMPGWGKSEAWNSEPMTGHTAEQIVLTLIEALGYDSAVIMGKSWGGGVALWTALHHPRQVAKLILTAPAFRDPGLLEALQQPVLLAWSEDDPVIPISHAQNFTNSISDVQLVIYPTGGHSAASKNADDFAPKAVKFLGKWSKHLGDKGGRRQTKGAGSNS